MTTTYTLTFPGGATITGTATEILDAWGAMAMPPHKPGDVAEIKIDLAKRAWIWNGALVDADLDDDAFLAAMAATALVERLDRVPTIG